MKNTHRIVKFGTLVAFVILGGLAITIFKNSLQLQQQTPQVIPKHETPSNQHFQKNVKHETSSSPRKTSEQNSVLQWTPETQLTNARSSIFYKAIAQSNNTLHFVWNDQNIFYRRSTDEGATWSNDLNLGKGVLYLEDPLAAEDSNVYVVYVKNIRQVTDWAGPRGVGDIFLRHSQDGGLTWQPEIQLTNAQGAFRISLAVSQSQLHLVWMHFRTGKWDVYYRRSLDNGKTWLPEVKLVTGTAGFGAERPQITSLGSAVHVAWMDGRDGLPPCIIESTFTLPQCTEIYYKRSTDGGNTWDSDIRLTSDSEDYAGRPDIAIAQPNTVIVSYDKSVNAEGLEQYIMRSVDNGTNWSEPKRLSFAKGDSTHGVLGTQGSNAHLAWFDRRDGHNSEIYYAISFNAGATWAQEEQVSFAQGESTTPFLAATKNSVHLIWGDQRSGTLQIWYRKRNL